MRVYRLCNRDEVESILKNRRFGDIGHKCQNDSNKNTHQYMQGISYMHFFEREIDLLYLSPSKGKMICVYEIPDDILISSLGTGFYLDFINFNNKCELKEYAVDRDKIKFENLKKVYGINEDLDFDYVPEIDEIYDNLTAFYDCQCSKEKLEDILKGDNAAKSIGENMGYLLTLIPEIKDMIGFKHKHPHHHLDVWQHTLEVLRNLNTKDLELNMAALFHDIGKPFSYQDEEVRHFHGHPKVSCEMTKQILTRLGYDEEFIKRVSYLVGTHDTIIKPDDLDNTPEMIQKRLQLQYADAKAHHPDKIEKRVKFLDSIKEQLQKIRDIER